MVVVAFAIRDTSNYLFLANYTTSESDLSRGKYLCYTFGMEKDRPSLTTPQAATLSGLTTSYITLLLREGKLEGFRLARDWFVYTDSLEAFLAKPRKPGPKGPRAKATTPHRKA
jgi:hypothetical protein